LGEVQDVKLKEARLKCFHVYKLLKYFANKQTNNFWICDIYNEDIRFEELQIILDNNVV